MNILYEYWLPDMLPLSCQSLLIRWQDNGNLFDVFSLYHYDI